MFGIKNQDSYYAGKECYKYTEDLLKEGKEIFIISPYIDEYYAHFIAKHAMGRKVYIISSSMEDKAKQILKGRFPIVRVAIVFAFIFFINFLAIKYGFVSTALLSFSFLLFLCIILFSSRRNTSIKIRNPRKFVHAKIYLSEKHAIQGSANLTYKGMHHNIEHIEYIENRERIAQLKQEFWKLWRSTR